MPAPMIATVVLALSVTRVSIGSWVIFADWVVLRQVSHEDVGTETDYRRLRAGTFVLAPSAAALRIAASVTGCRLDVSIPRSVETGTFGSRTTLPSGCTKNFTRSPGFKPRWSRIDFGIVA